MIDPNDLVVTLGTLSEYDNFRKPTYVPEQEALCFGAVPDFAEAQEEPESVQPNRISRRALDI